MLISLALAAVAAIAVGLLTAGSVIANKRATRIADAALQRYKLETAGKVADATTAGIAAGQKAGRAQVDVDNAKSEIAKANAEAARLSKEAADANLKTEQLKAAVAWRAVSVDQGNRMVQSLSAHPGAVNLRYTDGDPEALAYAIQFARVFQKAGWQVAPGSTKLMNALAFGIHVPTESSAEAPLVQQALTAAPLPFDPSALPPVGSEFNVSNIPGAPIILIGSRYPQGF